MVQALLVNMQEGLNIDKPMTIAQLDECAEEIVRQYPHFKIQDIHVFCNGCKFGRYGKVYNRLNGQILFEWLAEFDQERILKIQSDRRKEQDERAGKLDESDCDKWMDMSMIYERAREEQREKVKKRNQRQDAKAFAAERARQIEELKMRNADNT